jgi:hypothetical protein
MMLLSCVFDLYDILGMPVWRVGARRSTDRNGDDSPNIRINTRPVLNYTKDHRFIWDILTIITLFIRFIIIVMIVVSVVDTSGFYAVTENPTLLTLPFVRVIIIATTVPVTINFWYWLVFKQEYENPSFRSSRDPEQERIWGKY